MTESAPAAVTRAAPPPKTGCCGILFLLAFGLGAALVLGELLMWFFPVPEAILFQERDPEYGWRNVRGSVSFSHHGPEVHINSRGFRGPEFDPVKPPGVRRFFTMGCSCTIADNVGETETMAAQWQRRLNAAGDGTWRYEVINAGVGGYSTQMGKKWLANEIINYEPDLITIYYGWNDHWAARAGGTDRELDGSIRERVKYYALKSHLVQHFYRLRASELGARVESRIRRALAPPAAPAPAAGAPPATARDVTAGYRVSLREYEENLRGMIDLARAHDVKVILITAPLQYAVTDRHRGFTAATVPFIDGTDSDNVVINHHLYTDAVRRVGAAENVPVADLETYFNQLPQAERDILFYARADNAGMWSIDFVHPNAAGFAYALDELDRVFKDNYPEIAP